MFLIKMSQQLLDGSPVKVGTDVIFTPFRLNCSHLCDPLTSDRISIVFNLSLNTSETNNIAIILSCTFVFDANWRMLTCLKTKQKMGNMKMLIILY